MKYLVESHWQKLRVSSDGQFDGALFENLVEVLLLEEFGPGWIMTKRTRDGGKDFYRHERTGTQWAEAKIHNAPIQLKIIANTLVMAIIEEVHLVLLFSYSRLTDTTKRHLALFRKSSGAQIDVFDDELLELLILRHLRKLGSFFDIPRIEAELPAPQAILGSEELEIAHYVTQDLDYSPMPSQELPAQASHQRRRAHSIDRGGLVVYDILARNLTGQDIVAVVDLTGSGVCADFVLTNRDLTTRTLNLRLAPGELELVRLLFRPSTHKNRGSIEGILVRTDSRNYPVPQENFHLSNFYRPPLVGQRFYAIGSDFGVFAAIRRRPITCAIAGESGSGKTRLVESLMGEAAANGYQCHALASAMQIPGQAHSFIAAVVSKVFKLPVLAQEDMESALRGDGASSLHLVEQVLYQPGFDPAPVLDELAELTSQRMGLRPCFLICDDVQQLDSLGVRFLGKAIQALHGTGRGGGFLLVFNTNEIPFNPEAGALLQLITEQAERQPAAYRKYALHDFNEEDAKDFLNAMIAPLPGDTQTFSDVFPQTTKLLLSRAVNRPLHMYHTFKYLEQCGIVGRTAERFYVKRPEEMDSTLWKTPREIREIVALRWEASLIHRPDLAALMRLVSLFREIDIHHMEELSTGWDQDAGESFRKNIDLLREAGFLSLQGQNSVRFFHGQIAAYFIDLYAWPKEYLAATVSEFIQRKNLESLYYMPYFTCLSRLGCVTDQDLRVACARILRLNHDEQSLSFATQVRSALFGNVSALPPASFVSVLLDISRHVRRMQGYRAQNVHLAKDAQYLIDGKKLFHTAGAAVARLLHEYASSHIGLNENNEADEIIAHSLNELSQFSFEQSRERNMWEGLLLNRRCVTAKSLLLTRDALAFGLRSLRIGRELSDMVLVFRNLIDLGYIYYDTRPRLARVVHLWTQAVEVYDACRKEMSTEQATAELMRARLALLHGRPAFCIAIAEQETSRSMGRMDSFHAIKGMILQAVAYLAIPEPSDNQLHLAKILLDKSIDWSARYATNRFYWMAYYALAKIACLRGETREELTCYSLALEQLLRTHDEHGQYRMRYFFDDLIQAFAGSPEHPPESLVGQIAPPGVRTKVQSLFGGLAGAGQKRAPIEPSSPICSFRLGNLPGI